LKQAWAALAAGLLLFSGCGAPPAPPRASAPETGSVWRIGPFTVREVPLPAALVAQAFPRLGPYAVAGAGTLVRVSAEPPYLLYRKALDQKKWRSAGEVMCTGRPFFAQSQGPDAWLYCPGASGASTLVRVPARGPLQSLPISVAVPRGATRLIAYAEEFGGADGGVVWSVAENGEPPTPCGNGYVDLATGRSAALSPALSALEVSAPSTYTFLGPDDTLYEARPSSSDATTMAVYRWAPRVAEWARVAAVHRPKYADDEPLIAADGSFWSVTPVRPIASPVPLDWRVERAVPGSARVASWRIHGDLVGLGPGYVAYLPFDDPNALVLDFPTLRRSVSYRNLYSYPTAPYFLNDVATMDDGGSTLTGAQVVTIGTARGVRDLVITP